MSLLSQFFQNRHKDQNIGQQNHKNQEIINIFNNPITPENIISKSKAIKKQKLKKQINFQALPEQSQDQQNVRQSKNHSKKIPSKQKSEKDLHRNQKNNKKQKNSKQINNAKINKQQKTKIASKDQNKQQNKDSKVPQQEPENLDSTIFVGNVPLNSTHKSIKKFFQKYGKILKVWFRSIPVQQSKIPKKGLHILKKYQQGADSMNAYVKFQNQQQANAACQSNGQQIQGKNIKVTLCNQYSIDYDTTIFIGNLPRKVKDQQLWDAFKHIGTIKSVRVIRSKENMQSIGIGYIRFSNKQEMIKAIKQMNGKSISQRPMRIKKAVPKQRREKKFKKIKQKKQNKFRKSYGNKQETKNNQSNKTGKGIKYNNQQNQQKMPNKLGKPISKNTSFHKNKSANQQPSTKKTYNSKQVKKNESYSQNFNNGSNQVLRTKVKFQGVKKILQ